MDCNAFRRDCVEYLDPRKACGKGRPAEFEAHLLSCPKCALYLSELSDTLGALQPDARVSASDDFKENAMTKTIALETWSGKERRVLHLAFVRFWKPALAAGAAAMLLVAISLLLGPRDGAKPARGTAFSLFSKAMAAEEPLFVGESAVYMVTRVVVRALDDPALAGARWLPMISLTPSGKPRYDRLSLPAEVGEEYTLACDTWYDPATGRSARVMTARGELVFAASYDGAALYTLETDASGAQRIARHEVGADFDPAASVASILGIAGAQTGLLETEDENLFSDAGSCTLPDGSQGRAVKAGLPEVAGDAPSETYWVFRIRESDNMIAEMEFFIGGRSMLLVERASLQTAAPESWDLSALETRLAVAGTGQRPVVTPDMVIPDVSVSSMVERADFETYIFATAPSWTKGPRLSDILDVVSQPHRMFMAAYVAADGRHVVLVQSYTYNTILGPKAKTGTLVYTSPNGCKVWAGPKGKWLAGVLLGSARPVIGAQVAEDCVGYLIETPSGTVPALAVNGTLSDIELRALVDSLVPAKEEGGQ